MMTSREAVNGRAPPSPSSSNVTIDRQPYSLPPRPKGPAECVGECLFNRDEVPYVSCES
jgi:hypothetical protein